MLDKLNKSPWVILLFTLLFALITLLELGIGVTAHTDFAMIVADLCMTIGAGIVTFANFKKRYDLHNHSRPFFLVAFGIATFFDLAKHSFGWMTFDIIMVASNAYVVYDYFFRKAKDEPVPAN